LAADSRAVLEHFLHFCRGHITDALLECVPGRKRQSPAYWRLFKAQPGAAFACPCCNGLS
jgi:hypothetical protein